MMDGMGIDLAAGWGMGWGMGWGGNLLGISALQLDTLLAWEVLGNSLQIYLQALLTFLLGLVALKLTQRWGLRGMRTWVSRTDHYWDDALLQRLESSLIPLGYLGLVYISLRSLKLTTILSTMVNALGIILMTWLGTRLLLQLIDYSLRVYWKRYRSNKTSSLGFTILMPSIRVTFWAIGLMFLLDNLGFSISAVVTGLGIGGVAIALASRGVLEDLFSYFSILFDRPFDVGDFIVVESYRGTVESIGIKTTRLRSISGEQVILSNTRITSAAIQNLQRVQERQVIFKLGIGIQTEFAQIQQISALIAQQLQRVQTELGMELRLERCHWSTLTEQAYDFETIYYLKRASYEDYLRVQEQLNLALKQACYEQRISLYSLSSSSLLEGRGTPVVWTPSPQPPSPQPSSSQPPNP